MKKLYFLFSFAMLSFLANAQEAFITQWQFYDSNYTLCTPIYGTDNNYTVDFGDGTILTNQTQFIAHTYATTGTYTMTITGDFNRIAVHPNDKLKLTSVLQWGDTQWSSMEDAFFDCSNLTITATDTPDLSQVTNMSYMFKGCSSFNQSINDWDVSNVTDMENMFAQASSFNQPLNDWDVANVTNMRGMFEEATSFNQPLDNWNVSNVTNMHSMFRLTAFDQPINNWNVSNVIYMGNMFSGNTSFNQPLNNWDVSSVTGTGSMFSKASAFNGSLSGWDLSSVSSMNSMFFEATSFNQPINDWNVPNVLTMDKMFYKAYAFNQPLNNWDVSNAVDMTGMFWYATSFNQPLDNWDVSNAPNLQNMFLHADSFNRNLSSWEFHPNVVLGGFISFTSLNTINYDALLLRFAQLDLESKVINAPGLEYCNAEARDYLINQLNWNIIGDSLNPYCPGISGNVIFDENNDGCDNNDPKVNNLLVTANDGEYTYTTMISNGEYNLRLMEGIYTLQLLNLPAYYTATPATATVEFTSIENLEEEIDFCLTTSQTVSDLNITLLPLTGARPGFESQYRLVVQNMGTQTITDATATLNYNELLQEFVSATQAPAATATNELSFVFDNLAPFEIATIDITMQTFEPPTVSGGEIINFVASVTPEDNDYTLKDNTFTYDQTVVNSFDPNDKTVLQGSEIYMEQTDEYLDYIIRFQNTGTASAITVRIEDILHENLDWTTFTPISASHDYTVQITEGNQVEFIFNNINLPHEEADEPGSHGFVAYKIKPAEDIQIGDMITGTAGIYFDYNLPIITNSANTEVVEFLGVNDFVVKTIAVYPNPAKNIINIEPQENVIIEGVKIYNLQGREILSLNGEYQTVDLQNLSNGVYFLNIETDKGLSRHKLIKN